MIRVELGEEVDGPGENAGKRHGKWHWTCAEHGVEGFSRQPLLDACRVIKRMGANTFGQQIGLYRAGKDKPDMWCSVDWGADKTVDENGPWFVKYKPFNRENLNAQLDLEPAK